jgi:hypothetical protein
MFFFKKKSIEIVAFVNEHFTFVNTYSPITLAKNKIPEWWKSTERSKYDFSIMHNFNTVKSCPAVINSLQTGFILPLWCDIALKYDRNHYEYHSSDRMTNLGTHLPKQSPGLYDDYWHFKVNSPWLIKTPVKLLYLAPMYHQPQPIPFVTPSGIIPPVGGLCPTNIFLFAKKPEQEEKEEQVMIKQLTPILQILPLTEDSYTLRTEVLNMSEFHKYDSIAGASTSFVTRGLKNINTLKNNI